MNNFMEHPVTKDFLRLTRYNTPHGFELELYGDWLHQEFGAFSDDVGNQFVVVGTNPVLFTCHLDTVTGLAKYPAKLKRVWKKGGVLTTDGTANLGADDKAGAAVLMHMIRAEVPGVYAFFVGEERGCIGSRHMAGQLPTYLALFGLEGFDQVVSFDRFGQDSIITHQSGRCASDEYAAALAARYASAGIDTFAPDPTGIYTDSASFTELVGECTNVSIGYDGHHSSQERQDVPFLIAVAEASVRVPWGELPIVRQPGEDDEYEYMWERIRRYEREDAAYWRSMAAGHVPRFEEVIDPTRHLTDAELEEFVTSDPEAAALALGLLRNQLWEQMLEEGDVPLAGVGVSDAGFAF